MSRPTVPDTKISSPATTAWLYFYRTAFGPGWALAGDAGHHKDPATGFGISDAFASSEALAGALHDALSAERPWAEALGEYQRRRDATTEQRFHLTLSAAGLKPLSARMERQLAAAAARPEEVTRVSGALGGVIPADEVFSPDH